MGNEKVLHSLFRAIEEINRQRSARDKLEKAGRTVLLGGPSKLDSLGLINLMVTVEQKIEEDFGVAITLASRKDLFRERSPLATVATLAEYVASLLAEKSRA